MPLRWQAVLLGVLSILLMAFYMAAMLAATGGHLSLALDDSFIHFTYARSIAEGHPFRYNATDPPSTGATSLLYPALLAVFYWLGARGTTLILVVLALGFLFLLASTYLVASAAAVLKLDEEPVEAGPHPVRARVGLKLAALGAALLFLFNGSLVWGYLSGMETGLFCFFVLLTFVTAYQGCSSPVSPHLSPARLRRTGLVATLMTLARPEGLFLSGALALCLVGELWEGTQPKKGVGDRRPDSGLVLFRLWPLAFPVLAGLGQFAVNRIFTDNVAANGALAKAWLYQSPVTLSQLLGSIAGTYSALLAGLFAGNYDTNHWTAFFPPLLFLFFLLGVLPPAFGSGKERWPARVAALWFFGGVAATATLQTAAWHMDRYQMPFFALLLLYGLKGIMALSSSIDRAARQVLSTRLLAALPAGEAPPSTEAALTPALLTRQTPGQAVSAGILGFYLFWTVLSTGSFAGYYAQANGTLFYQQMELARWMRVHVPPGARVGVHDSGVLAYYGGHYTYDVIGLTTDGMALPWRNGPGSVLKHMANDPLRPSYFAVYPNVLYFFQNTKLFEHELYRVHVPNFSPVTSAEADQVIYQADWSSADAAPTLHSREALSLTRGWRLRDVLSVGDLASEQAHHYRWWNFRPGWPDNTLVRQHDYADNATLVLDGGRAISGAEVFTVQASPARDLLITLRTAADETPAPFGVRVTINGHLLGAFHDTLLPDHWRELTTRVPGSFVTSSVNTLRIEAETPGGQPLPYQSFRYWVWQQS